MYGAEVVEAEIYSLWQFLHLKSKLDADTKSRDVVHRAIVHGFPANEHLCGMADFGPLEPSFFHLGDGPLQRHSEPPRIAGQLLQVKLRTQVNQQILITRSLVEDCWRFDSRLSFHLMSFQFLYQDY